MAHGCSHYPGWARFSQHLEGAGPWTARRGLGALPMGSLSPWTGSGRGDLKLVSPFETSKSAEAANHQSSDERPPGRQTPKRRGLVRSAFDPRLVLPIKAIWGDQKVFRYSRQALASLRPHDAAEIAKFRVANAAIEARLWRKLPQRKKEIEFLYGGSRVSPEAGEGSLK